MPFSIDEFTSTLNDGSVAKPSLFMVSVNKADGSSNQDAMRITYRSDFVTFPTRQALTQDILVYGLPYPVGIGSSMASDIEMSVILSEDYREKEFFETWYDSIFGNYRTATNASSDIFDIKFPSSYYGTMSIWTYSDTGEDNYKINLIDVFPYRMGVTQLDWSAGNQISRMNITFKYRYYTEEYIKG